MQSLLDIEKIKQLKARYFRSLDTKDWDGLGSYLSADILFAVPPGKALALWGGMP